MSDYYYFDGNAVTFLWDKYTDYKKKGQTGDNINLSPFNNAVISVYTLDELITIPINNTYKKHLCFLSIFPDLPIFKPITGFIQNELDTISQDDLFEPVKFLNGVVAKRTAALTLPEHLKDLECDIKNKIYGAVMAESFLKRDAMGEIIYIDPKNRVSVQKAIANIVHVHKLNPKESAWDFYQFCMYLYVATRDRFIDVPTKYRKGHKYMLNHQIDFYHLSYLPFVKGFVTSDLYINMIAKEMIIYFDLKVELLSREEVYAKWIHELSSEK